MNTCVEAVAPSEVNVGCLPVVTQRALASRGISTVGQLGRIPKPVLINVFGEATGRELWAMARGRDPKKVGGSKLSSIFRRFANQGTADGRAGWAKSLLLLVKAGLDALDRALEPVWGVPTREVPRRTTSAP